jgi:hypothetical protein
MVRWPEEGDEESIFWKFVHILLPQIRSRGRDELFHEPEELEMQCHQIRLGNKRTIDSLIEGKCEQSKCVARYAANETKQMVRDKEPLLLLGVAQCIVMCMPANTKPAETST